MVMDKLRKIIIRKANEDDDLERIAELIYKTDSFIYPYWFGSIENCISILPMFMRKEHFIFNLNNIDVSVDEETNEILGIICSYKNDDNLDFDYTELENYNERFRFTIENYVKKLINEVKNADYAYISNICVHESARGFGIAGRLISYVKEKYKKQLLREIHLDVLINNVSAIKSYQKNNFNVSSSVFKGFSDPCEQKPEVVSMRSDL